MTDNTPTYEERKQALEHLVELGLVEYKQAAGLEYAAVTPRGLQYLGAIELLKLYNEDREIR